MESKDIINKIPPVSETIERNSSILEEKTIKDTNGNVENDVNVLSGDNKIDVDIEPDVKSNDVYLQLCSCSLVFNCLTKDSTAKNSD